PLALAARRSRLRLGARRLGQFLLHALLLQKVCQLGPVLLQRLFERVEQRDVSLALAGIGGEEGGHVPQVGLVDVVLRDGEGRGQVQRRVPPTVRDENHFAGLADALHRTVEERRGGGGSTCRRGRSRGRRRRRRRGGGGCRSAVRR